MTISAVTRGIVIASTVFACWLEAYLANTYTPQIYWLSIAGFIVIAIAGRRLHSAAMPVVMAALYLMPAIYLATPIGTPGYGLDVIWILPLMGLIVSDRGAWEWSLPARWRWPLV